MYTYKYTYIEVYNSRPDPRKRARFLHKYVYFVYKGRTVPRSMYITVD